MFSHPRHGCLPLRKHLSAGKAKTFSQIFILRCGKKDYCRDKVLTTAFSGVLVWLAAVLLGLSFFFILFYGREEIWHYPKTALPELLRTIGKICLISSSLTSFSAFSGALSGSAYLALGFPFILYSFGIILREHYLDFFYYIDPSEWILAKNDWGNTQHALWLFLLLLTVSMALLHLAVLERKVESSS